MNCTFNATAEARQSQTKISGTAGGGTTTRDAIGPGAPANKDEGNDAASTDAGMWEGGPEGIVDLVADVDPETERETAVTFKLWPASVGCVDGEGGEEPEGCMPKPKAAGTVLMLCEAADADDGDDDNDRKLAVGRRVPGGVRTGVINTAAAGDEGNDGINVKERRGLLGVGDVCGLRATVNGVPTSVPVVSGLLGGDGDRRSGVTGGWRAASIRAKNCDALVSLSPTSDPAALGAGAADGVTGGELDDVNVMDGNTVRGGRFKEITGNTVAAESSAGGACKAGGDVNPASGGPSNEVTTG